MKRRTVLAAAVLIPLATGCPHPVVAPPRKKVALVLGGGGARGFAHVGVLRVLADEHVPIDLVVGSSAGSLIGAFYADRGSVDRLERIAATITQDDVFDFSLFGLSKGPLAGAALERLVERNLHTKSFEGLRVPFVAVATDLDTGAEVELDSGPIGSAVRASSAIPGVFRPVPFGTQTLVDGGVVSPIPVAVARRRGADIVIAVDISQELPPERAENAYAIAMRSFSILSREVARTQLKSADVVIAPAVGDLSPFDFTHSAPLIAAGGEAARIALPAIRAALASPRLTASTPPAGSTSSP